MNKHVIKNNFGPWSISSEEAKSIEGDLKMWAEMDSGLIEAEENYYVDVSPDRRLTWGRASELMVKEAAYIIKNEIEENEGGMYEACVRFHNHGSPLPQRKYYFSATED